VRGVIYRPRDRVLLAVGWSVCSLLAQNHESKMSATPWLCSLWESLLARLLCLAFLLFNWRHAGAATATGLLCWPEYIVREGHYHLDCPSSVQLCVWQLTLDYSRFYFLVFYCCNVQQASVSLHSAHYKSLIWSELKQTRRTVLSGGEEV